MCVGVGVIPILRLPSSFSLLLTHLFMFFRSAPPTPMQAGAA